jgi:MFS transporter, DHA1 family, multidrug resistance protein
MNEISPENLKMVATRGARVRIIMLLGLLVAIGAMAIDMYLPALPDIAKGLATSDAAIQRTVSVFLLGFGAGMLIYGPVSDRFGRRKVILSGLLVFFITSVMAAYVSTADELFLMRIFQSIGGGAAAVLGRTIVRDLFEGVDAAKVLSMIHIVVGVAPLIAPTLGGQILLYSDWRGIFLGLAVFGAICLSATFFMLKETLPPEQRGDMKLAAAFIAYGHLLKDRYAVGHVIGGGLTTAAMFVYITGSPMVYISYYGVAPEWFGMLFSVNVFGLFLSSYLNIRLLKHYTVPQMTTAGQMSGAFGAVGLLILGGTGTFGIYGILIPTFFIVGINGMVSGNCNAILMQRYPRNAGAASALFGATRVIFGAIGGILLSIFTSGTPLTLCLAMFFCAGMAPVVRLGLAREKYA